MKSLIPALAATVLLSVTVAASPADAGSAAEITRGRFQTTSTGADLGFDITGRAVMVRSDTGGGRTLVVSIAYGLEPGTTYGSHVHNAPCSVNGGGGHYQHEVGPVVDAVNEIWPVLHAQPSGVAHGMAVHGHRARPEAQSIVIHASGGARIACLDLG
jgi:Cu-Zn family superoxide dismutase